MPENLFALPDMGPGLTHPVISRIAPTPSGYLHEGNAFSFVLTWLIVRKSGGKLLLRIDDNDAARKRPEYIEDIFQTIEWLGLDYDLGPQGPDDFEKNYSQQMRLDLYSSVLEDLSENPALVYACRCSRKEVQLNSKNGLYPGTCREAGMPISAENAALRLRMPEQEEVSFFELLTNQVETLPIGQLTGDFVLRRRDRLPAYQLVSLADDMDYGINLLVRGSDLLESTGAQLYLATCLKKNAGKFQKSAEKFLKAKFLHHPLILNGAGEKLSKSKGAASILGMRQSGKGPSEIYARVARFAGIQESTTPRLGDLLQAFDISQLQKHQHLRKGPFLAD